MTVDYDSDFVGEDDDGVRGGAGGGLLRSALRNFIR